jgi:hypothetical protein
MFMQLELCLIVVVVGSSPILALVQFINHKDVCFTTNISCQGP